MTFDYSSNATSLSTGTYTAVTALSFTAPEAAATGIIDGNASVNQVSVSGAISGLAWAPGATIYLRWTDTDTTGSDDGLAIDSLSITTGNSVPVQAANLGLTVTGGTTTALTATELSYTDAEQVASAVTYTLSSIPATGTLSLSGTPLAIASTFTQADLNGGLVTYNALTTSTNVSFDFTVSDGQGGVIASATFAITVNGVGNSAPTVTVNSPLTVSEGGSATITSAFLTASDDTDVGAALVYTVSSSTSNGMLLVNSFPAATFTQADIAAGLVSYVHVGSETTSDSLVFTVADSASATSAVTTFNIVVTAVNDAPVVVTNTGASVTHGDTITIGSTRLSTSDADNTSAQIVYTVTSIPTGGVLKLSGVDLAVNGIFSQADVDGNLVTYVAPASGTSDSFGFSVIDGTASPITGTFNIALNAVPEMYINEIYFNPQGTDAPNEFVELRGTPSATIPSNTYLLGIEGDVGSPNPGDVQNIFNLSGLTFGSNGLLLLLQKGATYDVTAATTAGTSIYINSGTGAGWGNGASSSVSHSADSGATDIENGSSSFLLVRAAVAPAITDDIDTDNDGTPEAGTYGGWTIVDSVGAIGNAAGSFGYAAINFMRGLTSTGTSSTGTVIAIGDEVEYIARVGSSTGSAAADWFAADTIGAAPTHTFDTVGEDMTDASLRGASVTAHLGLPNVFVPVAPTDLNLSLSSVDENVPVATNVGIFSTVDPTTSDTFTYTLVSGTGSDDNASFAITGDVLSTNVSLDFEVKSSYTIQLRTTDAGGTNLEKVFVISVNDLNEAPTVTAGQSFSVDENSAAGAAVGTVLATDPDAGETATLTFAKTGNGIGASLFYVAANGQITVATGAVLDFETTPSYTLEVKATDTGSPALDSPAVIVTINLTDVPESTVDPKVSPTVALKNSGGTDVTLTKGAGSLSLAEHTITGGATDGDLVGTLTVTNAASYALTGGSYNTTDGVWIDRSGAFSFKPSNGKIEVYDASKVNYESVKSVKLGFSFANNALKPLVATAAITITVTTVNEAPVFSTPDSFTINENNKAGATVGSVKALDPEKTAVTYAVTAIQNASNVDITAGNLFAIDSAKGKITVASPLDYEAGVRMGDLRCELEPLPVPAGANSSGPLGWHSRSLPSAEASTWVTLDLGQEHPIDMIVMVPTNGESEGINTAGYGFPLRFRVELSEVEDFAAAIVVDDFANSDTLNPGSFPLVLKLHSHQARFIRVTFLKAWPRRDDWIVVLGEIMVISGTRNVAAGARVSVSNSSSVRPTWSPEYLVDGQSLLGPPVNREPSPSNGYLAIQETSPDVVKWVQVDFGHAHSIEEVRLFPTRPTDFADTPGTGFPPRFRIETADDPEFESPNLVFETGSEEMLNPGDNPISIAADGRSARWLRITANRLRDRGSQSSFSLAELQVWSHGVNVALRADVTALDAFDSSEYPRWRPEYLVDGFNSRNRILDFPVWLEGLARRHEIVLELDKLDAERAAAVEATFAFALKCAAAMLTSILVIGAAAFWRSQHLRHREVEQLRLRIASDLHDEIGSQLGSIALAAQLAARRADDPESSRRRIEEIERIACETNESMHDIVWLLKPGNASLQELLVRLRESAAKQLRDHQYEFDVADSLPSRALGIDFARNVLLLFNEALQNIVKHAQAKSVHISLNVRGGHLLIAIHDDGVGYNTSLTLPGNGLTNMQHRTEQMRGTMTIRSSLGLGTTISVDVPIG